MENHNRLFLSFLGGVLLIAGLTLAKPAAAALSLVPPSLEYTSVPGQTIETTIKLVNSDQAAITVTPSTAVFKAKDDAGTPDFDFAGAPGGLAAWITYKDGPLSIPSNEPIEFPVTIEIPKNAEPGGHYAGLFFTTTAAPGAGQIAVQSRIGTLVVLRIEGAVQESAQVKSFSALTKGLNRLPVELSLVLSNTGNVHFRPKGYITIRNMFGGTTATLPINPQEGAVLPNSDRKFDVLWKKADITKKQGSFFEELSSEFSNFAFGGYTAELAATYGSNKQNLVGSFHMTIVPWRVLLVLGLGLIIVIFGLTFGLKQYNASIVKKAEASIAKKQQEGRPPKV